MVRQLHREFGIPASVIKPLVKFMVSEGVLLDELLLGTNITLSDFTLSHHTLMFEQYIKLILNARRLCNKTEYALILGEQFFINHDDLLACRVLSAPNTQGAMELLTQYQTLFTPLLDLKLEIQPHQGVFYLNEKVPLGDALPHFIEYSCSLLYSLGKFSLGQKDIQLEFEFSHSNPSGQLNFEHFFNNPVRFDCAANRVIIPQQTLQKAIIFSNHDIALENEKICQQQKSQINSDQRAIKKVKQFIRSMAFNEISLEILAQKLHMSTRSLRRHLQEQGVSYKSLLENERKRIALRHVEKQDINLEQLAELLGYHNASSFSRAFKRWFGVAPNHYLSASQLPSEAIAEPAALVG
jgi:AraC-like DNA-binding protein